MRRWIVALTGAVMLSWSGTSLAASLADRALGFEGSLTSPGLRLPHAGQLHLGGQGEEGAVQNVDSNRGLVAVLLTLFVGFGTGHFIIGDGAAWLFLGLNVGVIGGMVAVFAAAYMVALSGGFPVLVMLGVPLLGLAATAVRIWEIVDIILKSGLVGGPKPEESEVILPRGSAFAQRAFEPAFANVVSLRF